MRRLQNLESRSMENNGVYNGDEDVNRDTVWSGGGSEADKWVSGGSDGDKNK